MSAPALMAAAGVARTALVVLSVPASRIPGDDGQQPGGDRFYLAQVGGGAHNATAARITGGRHPGAHQFGGRLRIAGQDRDPSATGAGSPARSAPSARPSTAAP